MNNLKKTLKNVKKDIEEKDLISEPTSKECALVKVEPGFWGTKLKDILIEHDMYEPCHRSIFDAKKLLKYYQVVAHYLIIRAIPKKAAPFLDRLGIPKKPTIFIPPKYKKFTGYEVKLYNAIGEYLEALGQRNVKGHNDVYYFCVGILKELSELYEFRKKRGTQKKNALIIATLCKRTSRKIKKDKVRRCFFLPKRVAYEGVERITVQDTAKRYNFPKKRSDELKAGIGICVMLASNMERMSVADLWEDKKRNILNNYISRQLGTISNLFYRDFEGKIILLQFLTHFLVTMGARVVNRNIREDAEAMGKIRKKKRIRKRKKKPELSPPLEEEKEIWYKE